MASMSNSRFQELEDRLSEKTRINVAFAEQQLAERKEADQLRRARYVIPRQLAAPVERIVATYDDVRADLYSVLGVPRSADDFALKRQYRALALQVHPGKFFFLTRVTIRTALTADCLLAAVCRRQEPAPRCEGRIRRDSRRLRRPRESLEEARL